MADNDNNDSNYFYENVFLHSYRAKLRIILTQQTKHDNFLNENVFCCFTTQKFVNKFKYFAKQTKLTCPIL